MLFMLQVSYVLLCLVAVILFVEGVQRYKKRYDIYNLRHGLYLNWRGASWFFWATLLFLGAFETLEKYFWLPGFVAMALALISMLVTVYVYLSETEMWARVVDQVYDED